jgi:GH15 family glucan-1,4-alpha-glucosidase
MSQSRVEQLWQHSQKVLEDCALPNGAIVAANPATSEYPPTAENYGFVWGRDTAFQLKAADTLAMPYAADIRAKYLGWLWERAEGFAGSGLIIKRYSPNGSLDWRYGRQYQPDQAGALLWALTSTASSPDQLTDRTIRHLANGLTSQWDGNHFKSQTQDIWENRTTDPVRQDVFNYSLAAAAYGLGCAVQYDKGSSAEIDDWQQTRREMWTVIKSGGNHRSYLRKSFPEADDDQDNTIDGSLSGLIYPFEADAAKAKLTIGEIARQLDWAPDGLYRYQGDTYDGIVRHDGREATAGKWPLLSFWLAIAHSKIDEFAHSDLARREYLASIDHLDELYTAGVLPDNLIPEQLFDDSRQGRGVLPLAWSHAMFVIATKELDQL